MLLAIDPGTKNCGVCVAHGDGRYECKVWTPAEVLAFVRSDRMDLVSELIVEQIASYGMSVSESVFGTCRLIGRIQEAAFHSRGEAFPVALVPRLEVRMELCGSPRAKDPDIRQRLISMHGGTAAMSGVECGWCDNKAAKRRKCESCDMTGYAKQPNFLASIRGDAWQAFGLAVAWRQMVPERRRQFIAGEPLATAEA